MSYLKSSNLLIFIVALFITIKLTTVVLIYKIVNIFGINISVSTIIIPLWFIIGDVITELYGYKTTKQIIYFTIAMQILFGLLVTSCAILPSSTLMESHNELYVNLFGNMLLVTMASTVGILFAGIYNSYFYEYIKNHCLMVKSFYLRSIIASSLSEILFTLIVFTIEFYRYVSISNMVKLIIVSFVVKQLLTPIYAILFATPFIKYIYNSNTANTANTANIPKRQIIEMYVCHGKSYFRTLNVLLDNNHPLGMYSDLISVAGMQFREFDSGLEFDYHVAPNKQYILYIEGEVEVETSGGEKKVFSAGDILLANDLTGSGHITRTLKSGKSIVIKA